MTQVSISMDKNQWNRINWQLRTMPHKIEAVVGKAVEKTTVRLREQILDFTRFDLKIAKNKLFQKGKEGKPVLEMIRGWGYTRHGVVTAKGERIPISRFTPKQQTKKGKAGGRRNTSVSFQIGKKGGRRKVRKRLFLIEFKSGHKGIYYRQNRSRLPLAEAFGPSVYQVLDEAQAFDKLEKEGIEFFQKVIDQRLNFILKGRN